MKLFESQKMKLFESHDHRLSRWLDQALEGHSTSKASQDALKDLPTAYLSQTAAQAAVFSFALKGSFSLFSPVHP